MKRMGKIMGQNEKKAEKRLYLGEPVATSNRIAEKSKIVKKYFIVIWLSSFRQTCKKEYSYSNELDQTFSYSTIKYSNK